MTTDAIDLTDPPGMPADERMTDAELRTVREFLGLTGDWLAAHLHVDPRSVRRWEQGSHPIHDGIRLAVEQLEGYTGQCIGAYVQALGDMPDPCVLVYRTDGDLADAGLEYAMPASWHRAVVARVALEVPGLRIVYADRQTVKDIS